MKLQFLATAQAPESYQIDGETITAHEGDKSEKIDLSPIEEGGQFQGVELDTLDLPASQVIRHAERKDGELYVTLCQATPPTRVEITFQDFTGRVRISYDRYIELGITEGEAVPAEVKDKTTLKQQLTGLFIRENDIKELTDEHRAVIEESYKDTDLIADEVTLLYGGHWRKSDWIDADDYDPTETYIKRID